MDIETLKKLINEHRPASLRVYDQKTYKIGANAGIYQYPKHEEPDNRVPVPFIRRAVKLVKGYFAKVGNITYTDDGWFEENLADTFDANDEEIETAAVFEDALVYGRAYELHWFDELEGFHFTVLPIDQCIPIFSDDVIPKMVGFIWHRKSGDIERATYYDDREYQEFTKDDEEWRLDEERSGLHLYGRVPVLEAVIDRDKRNLFDHCLPLIDLYDKIVSEVGNEHEKFAQSVLLLREAINGVTEDENGMTDIDKLKQWRVLDKLGDNVGTAAGYLERNVNDTFINNTLDRIERLIYEMLCLFNPNDESFATASGIAQAYKLLGFELSVADMESYFSRFLQERLKMISGHKSGRVKNIEMVSFVTIHFARNLPFNMESFAQLASILSGGKQILSTESIRKLMPATMVSEDEADKIVAETPAVSNPFGSFE